MNWTPPKSIPGENCFFPSDSCEPSTLYGWDDVDGWQDVPMPDIRNDWKKASSDGQLTGCGLHKNFTYDELCELEKSLSERRIMAGVPTPDVIEYYEAQKKTQYKHKRNFTARTTLDTEESLKALKERLKREILKELLEELKDGI